MIQTSRAITAGQASWSSPIGISSLNSQIWVVNPDSGSVSVVDPASRQLLQEIKVGQEPWSIVIAPDGSHVFVLDRATGSISSIDASKRVIVEQKYIGVEPIALAESPSGRTLYVTLSSTGEIVSLDSGSLQIIKRLSVAPEPYAIAVSNDGDTVDDDETVYITHFLAQPIPGGSPGKDNGRAGIITAVDAKLSTIVQTIRLAPDEHGFPHSLAGIALNGRYAWVPQVRASPELPNELTTTVFAAVATLDLQPQQEDRAAFLPLNDQSIFASPVNNPVAAIPSPDGRSLYVVLAGSNLVEVIDISIPTHPRLVRFLPTGSNPRGMAISADGRYGYVMSYLSRTLTVLDLEQLQPVGDVRVTEEPLSADVLRGKILFNTVADPRMAKVSWISCASCHADGGTDGVTWPFPDGPRQTPPLWNVGATLPWHWSAALDEPQDIENTIQTIQFGLGLAPGADPPQLGAPNAGRSADLDALGAYILKGIRTPRIAPAASNLDRGRALFVERGCVQCHSGPNWTLSRLPGIPGELDPDQNGMVDQALRNVGTATDADVRGATGFDVPSLLDIARTAPYLHDGSLPDLGAILDSGHPQPGDTTRAPLSPQDRAALIAFLASIGPDTVPFEEP